MWTIIFFILTKSEVKKYQIRVQVLQNRMRWGIPHLLGGGWALDEKDPILRKIQVLKLSFPVIADTERQNLNGKHVPLPVPSVEYVPESVRQIIQFNVTVSKVNAPTINDHQTDWLIVFSSELVQISKTSDTPLPPYFLSELEGVRRGTAGRVSDEPGCSKLQNNRKHISTGNRQPAYLWDHTVQRLCTLI